MSFVGLLWQSARTPSAINSRNWAATSLQSRRQLQCRALERFVPQLQTAEAQQLAYLLESVPHMFDAALEDHAAKLQERRAELGQLAPDTSEAVDDIASVLAAQLREAKLQHLLLGLEELIYVTCLHKLACAGVELIGAVDNLTSASVLVGDTALPALTQQDLSRLLSPAVADAVVGLVASTFGGSATGEGAVALVTHIDRVQAARLYAGQMEYGYFVRSIEAMCRKRGIMLGSDSSELVAFAAGLPKDELRAACAVQSHEAWRCAVRHAGQVFGLQPAGPGEGEGPDALPFPQLAVTAAGAQFAPAAHLAEYYDSPGAAEAEAAAAASKAARGWRQPMEGERSSAAAKEHLPAPDLITMRLDSLQQLLMEGAALGAVLFDAEHSVQDGCALPLTRRPPPLP